MSSGDQFGTCAQEPCKYSLLTHGKWLVLCSTRSSRMCTASLRNLNCHGVAMHKLRCYGIASIGIIPVYYFALCCTCLVTASVCMTHVCADMCAMGLQAMVSSTMPMTSSGSTTRPPAMPATRAHPPVVGKFWRSYPWLF